MEITVNIKMIGLEGGNVERMEEVLSCIKKLDAKIIISIDSSPGSLGMVRPKIQK